LSDSRWAEAIYVKSTVVGLERSVLRSWDEVMAKLSIIGLLGRSICEVVLINIATIADMVGLSPGFS
jgi:hypothetical protein